MVQILKNKQNNKCVRIHEIMRLIVMKMKMKMKNISHIHDIKLGTMKNRPRSRHGHKYSEYKNCLSMMTCFCIKQHLCDI